MALWTIGDLHLSFGMDKPMDIFGKHWSRHEERIKENWLSLVSAEDTVVLPGDLSWAMTTDQLLPDLMFLHALPGKKLLGKGNHDYWWQTQKKMDAFFAEHDLTDIALLHNNAVLYDEDTALCGTRGWTLEDMSEKAQHLVARECGRLELSLKAAPENTKKIVFMHYPPVRLCGEEQPFVEIMKKYGVEQCFYGHLHAASIKNAVIGEHFGINFSLVSADSLDFCMHSILK